MCIHEIFIFVLFDLVEYVDIDDVDDVDVGVDIWELFIFMLRMCVKQPYFSLLPSLINSTCVTHKPRMNRSPYNLFLNANRKAVPINQLFRLLVSCP